MILASLIWAFSLIYCAINRYLGTSLDQQDIADVNFIDINLFESTVFHPFKGIFWCHLSQLFNCRTRLVQGALFQIAPNRNRKVTMADSSRLLITTHQPPRW